LIPCLLKYPPVRTLVYFRCQTVGIKTRRLV